MKNFFEVLSVAEAISRLCSSTPLPPVKNNLLEAGGFILAQDVKAPENLPLGSRSSMDGYAVMSADTYGAGESNPAYLNCARELRIDDLPDFALRPGECARIVTGALLPEGADAVLMVEQTEELGAGTIEIRKSVAPSENVMFKGEDCAQGDIALEAGTLLRPQELGLLAALGVTEFATFAKPKVALLSTGNEIRPVTSAIRPGQVRDVNSTTLCALLKQNGFASTALGIAEDSEEALLSDMQEAMREHDLLFISGGSSLGRRDLTKAAVMRLPQVELLAHGLALSPGKPIILARCPRPRGEFHIWGLPGQVTSVQVAAFVLGIPFLRHLSGYSMRYNPFDQSTWAARRVILARNIASNPGREDYIRVALERAGPERGSQKLPLARPLAGKSGLLRTLLQADGLVRIPSDLEGLKAGEEADMLIL